MIDRRPAIGRRGEDVAAAFLASHGLQLVARNVAVAGGELDILAQDGATRVAVEVRSITGSGDPMQAFDAAKERQVARLGRMAGAQRIDVVAVHLDDEAAEIRWVRGAA